jgi:hypothetical protein
MTTSVSKLEEIMPPIIGTAMRCITSAPVPWAHMIGSNPAMMAQTVINEEHTLSGCIEHSMTPQNRGGRQGRARAYVVMADRLQFHLEAGTLPPEAAEHVRHAHDALMKASAALRPAEIEKVSMPESPAKPNVTGP